MRHSRRFRQLFLLGIAGVAGLALGTYSGLPLRGQTQKPASPPAQATSAESLPAAVVLEPDGLNKVLQSSTGEKPLVLQVGFDVLYRQVHIPGSEYAGPASKEDGMQVLRKRPESVPHDKFIVLYCGCCPWDHCPNVKPAYDAMKKMGFTNVKVMHVANNLATDWIDKGFPISKGQ